MRFQDIVLKVYTSVFKRAHNWGLFFLLALLYLTALGIRSDNALLLFSRVGIMALHVFCGFVLAAVFVLLAYDYILRKVTRKPVSDSREDDPEEPEAKEYRLIDYLFYYFLIIIGTLGMMYYITRAYSLNSLVFSQITLSMAHEIIGWFFLSIIFLKYYLSIIRWFKYITRYLQEY